MSDTRHSLQTLENILEIAQTTGLFGRGDMVPETRLLLEFAQDQIDRGDRRYGCIRSAATEALALMEASSREKFDQFTNDRVLMNGDMGTQLLEDLDCLDEDDEDDITSNRLMR